MPGGHGGSSITLAEALAGRPGAHEGPFYQNRCIFQAVIECLVACVFSGIVFALFSGQPLCIMGATGPVLIFEALFHEFCTEHGWSFLVARFWLMFWGAVILLTLVALDASFLVAYITRFTEETFAVLIALVFIVESFEVRRTLLSER